MCRGSILSEASIAGRLELEEGFPGVVEWRVLKLVSPLFILLFVRGEYLYDADETFDDDHGISMSDRLYWEAARRLCEFLSELGSKVRYSDIFIFSRIWGNLRRWDPYRDTTALRKNLNTDPFPLWWCAPSSIACRLAKFSLLPNSFSASTDSFSTSIYSTATIASVPANQIDFTRSTLRTSSRTTWKKLRLFWGGVMVRSSAIRNGSVWVMTRTGTWREMVKTMKFPRAISIEGKMYRVIDSSFLLGDQGVKFSE
jgi:hypothetical protein